MKMSKKINQIKLNWLIQRKKALNLKIDYYKLQDKVDRVTSLKLRLDHINKSIEKIVQLEDNQNSYSIDEGVILDIQNLTMKFGGLTAVDDLSFKVKKGEIFGLIGPNGAGKTTIFNCITQFYKTPHGRTLFVNNENELVNLSEIAVHNVIKEGVVRTFQNIELIWELSILENLLIAGHTLYTSNFFDHLFRTPKYRREDKVIRAKAMHILKELNLEAYTHVYPLGLPYGILKLVELARTLMTNPSLIILDEPAAGLNEQETEKLAQTIKKIQQDFKATIFLVEHDMGFVMNLCNTICAISFGKMLAIGTPEEIKKHPKVQEAYLGGE